MQKTTKGIVAIGILAIIGFVGYKVFVKTKRQKVNYLITYNYTQGTPEGLMAFGDDFIDAWYKGAKAGKKLFNLAGTFYNTQGGKAQ